MLIKKIATIDFKYFSTVIVTIWSLVNNRALYYISKFFDPNLIEIYRKNVGKWMSPSCTVGFKWLPEMGRKMYIY